MDSPAEWASDVRWFILAAYIIMVGAVIYVYIKTTANGKGDGFAQQRKGQRREKEGRRGYDGYPRLETGYGKDKDKPSILDHDGDNGPDHDNRIL